MKRYSGIAGFLVLVGCGEGAALEVGTYNGGLALNFVDYASVRSQILPAAVAAEDLGLLCVQEFWEEDDWTALATAVAETAPYTVRRAAEQGTAGVACVDGELDALEVCVAANCADAGEALASCALSNCQTEVGALPTSCFTCLAANVTMPSVDAIKAVCEAEGSGGFAFEGSFGTGILSAYEIAESDTTLFPSTITRRAGLYAHVTGTPIGEVHFFCTHLTASLDSVPYRGEEFDSYEAEQANQIAMLLAWIDSKTEDGDQIILAGDLNNGPAIGEIEPELETNYQMWLAAGLRNPYVEQGPACTFCDANLLNEGVMAGGGGLIDHILVDAIEANMTAERFLTSTVEIESGGEMVTTNYSDHYGLRLRVSP